MFSFIKAVATSAFYFLTTPGRMIAALFGLNEAASNVVGILVAGAGISLVGFGTYVVICLVPVLFALIVGVGLLGYFAGSASTQTEEAVAA